MTTSVECSWSAHLAHCYAVQQECLQLTDDPLALHPACPQPPPCLPTPLLPPPAPLQAAAPSPHWHTTLFLRRFWHAWTRWAPSPKTRPSVSALSPLPASCPTANAVSSHSSSSNSQHSAMATQSSRPAGARAPTRSHTQSWQPSGSPGVFRRWARPSADP